MGEVKYHGSLTYPVEKLCISSILYTLYNILNTCFPVYIDMHKKMAEKTKNDGPSIDALPDHLFHEILFRLSVKPALRFRCVSKAWRTFFADRGPYMTRRLPSPMYGFFYQRPTNHSWNYVHRPWNYAPVYPFKDQHFDLTQLIAHLPNHRHLTLLDCCNGLLLLCFGSDAIFNCMIVCNPADKTNWVIIRMNVTTIEVEQLLRCRFVGSRLLFDRHAGFPFMCFLFFKDGQTRAPLTWSQLHRNRKELLNKDSYPCFKIWCDRSALRYHSADHELMATDVDLIDESWNACTIDHLEDEDAVYFLPHISSQGSLSRVIGKCGGFLHGALCNERELRVWINVAEAGQRVWKVKHASSCQTLIERHKESHRRPRHDADGITYAVLPLGFHPDFDIIFLQIEWIIYSLHLGSGAMEELGGERGANPRGERFSFCPFTWDPFASLGDRKRYQVWLGDQVA
ncbi:hypothetical protein BHE74_00039452 [Ensete ventricosum]|nr:hypothetical protein BHE74_00039452 [Ensete ventricosum]